jgi:hypothetical protein
MISRIIFAIVVYVVAVFGSTLILGLVSGALISILGGS